MVLSLPFSLWSPNHERCPVVWPKQSNCACYHAISVPHRMYWVWTNTFYSRWNNTVCIIYQQHFPSDLSPHIPLLQATEAVLTQETFLFLSTFDMSCGQRGQRPTSPNTRRLHTRIPVHLQQQEHTHRERFSFDFLLYFPLCQESVSHQSHPAKRDPKFTQDGEGG